MTLTRTEKERLSDSRLKIQSIAKSLKHVNPEAVRGLKALQQCLEHAEHTLVDALRSSEN